MFLRMFLSLFLSAIILSLCPHRAGAGAELPPWRIQVRAYGPEQASFVAIHHRITDRSELGLQLAGTISDSNTDRGVKYDDSTDRSSSAITLRPEFRRWFVREDRLSTFWGWNVLVGYSKSESDQQRVSSTYESHTDSDDLSLGAGFTMGADLELLDHLSITMAVSPISFSRVWNNTKDTRGTPGSMETTKTRNHDLSVDIVMTPALYACIRF